MTSVPARPADLPPPPDYPIEIAARDIAPYGAGNTGVPWVHSFTAARPGLHVMVNALTHGNEPCGADAVAFLLDTGIRPRRGRLTLSFANVEAYARFAAGDVEARFVDRDLNRLWRDDVLDADTISVEALRARALRPLVRTVDRLLDLHSTWHALLPFFVRTDLSRAAALADELGFPPRQLVLPAFRHEGWHMIDDAPFADPAGSAVGLIAECGQHWAGATAETARRTALRFLAVCGTLDKDEAAALGAAAPKGPFERFRIVEPVMAASDDVRLVCSYAGFESFPRGAVVGWDGEAPIAAPFDEAVVIAPRPNPRRGMQIFAWGRRL